LNHAATESHSLKDEVIKHGNSAAEKKRFQQFFVTKDKTSPLTSQPLTVPATSHMLTATSQQKTTNIQPTPSLMAAPSHHAPIPKITLNKQQAKNRHPLNQRKGLQTALQPQAMDITHKSSYSTALQ
jgi:hypothetical protein